MGPPLYWDSPSDGSSCLLKKTKNLSAQPVCSRSCAAAKCTQESTNQTNGATGICSQLFCGSKIYQQYYWQLCSGLPSIQTYSRLCSEICSTTRAHWLGQRGSKFKSDPSIECSPRVGRSTSTQRWNIARAPRACSWKNLADCGRFCGNPCKSVGSN